MLQGLFLRRKGTQSREKSQKHFFTIFQQFAIFYAVFRIFTQIFQRNPSKNELLFE